MEKRNMTGRPYEQKWCGTWWDCPHCTASALDVSPELQKQLAEQAKRSGQKAPQQSSMLFVTNVY
jgi:hypothetical protein